MRARLVSVMMEVRKLSNKITSLEHNFEAERLENNILELELKQLQKKIVKVNLHRNGSANFIENDSFFIPPTQSQKSYNYISKLKVQV